MSQATFKLQGTRQSSTLEVRPADHTAVIDGQVIDAGRIAFDIPVSGTVYGTLLNYQGALQALGGTVEQPPYQAPPQAPILYIKPANTLSANHMPIPLPEGVPALEAGAALGIVIGRQATRVAEDDALSYVAGYTVVNDVSIPHDSVYRPAIVQKCQDGFCPIGPWVVHAAAVPNPDGLRIQVYVNGELRQENTTAHLIRSVSRLLSDVTEFMTLNPGDVLLVGVPEGAPQAKAGDHIRIDIEHVGRLENVVVPERDCVSQWVQRAVNS